MGRDRTLLLTGFPGFIGGRLVEQILEVEPSASIVCLVEKRFEFQAREQVRRLSTNGGSGGRSVSVAVGDITLPGLGLEPDVAARLPGSVTDVFHLAAVDDLAVPEPLARRVNVRGTRHVIDLCRSLGGLERFVYFSTCHVSGSRTGTVYEDELDMGQRFRNHHESTKHDAEYLVRQAAREMPTIILRPSFVVGDRRTGEVPRFDGPYLVMGLVDRLSSLHVPMPYVGERATELNLVPVDYVLDATVALWRDESAPGGTFALADPRPMLGREIYAEIVRGVGALGPLGRIPPALLDAPLRLPRVRRLLGVPRELLAYLDHPVHYDCARAVQALEPRGIACPDLRSYLPGLIEYYLANRERTEMRWQAG